MLMLFVGESEGERKTVLSVAVWFRILQLVTNCPRCTITVPAPHSISEPPPSACTALSPHFVIPTTVMLNAKFLQAVSPVPDSSASHCDLPSLPVVINKCSCTLPTLGHKACFVVTGNLHQREFYRTVLECKQVTCLFRRHPSSHPSLPNLIYENGARFLAVLSLEY